MIQLNQFVHPFFSQEIQGQNIAERIVPRKDVKFSVVDNGAEVISQFFVIGDHLFFQFREWYVCCRVVHYQ
jgi:hypothetical protein